jgi:undecaprenyl-diphosphatase
VNSIVVFVAQYFLYLSALIAVWYWFTCPTPTKIELIVRWAIGGVLALAMAKIASQLYYDPRPFASEHIKPLFAHAADNGFPSDHALLISLLGFTVVSYSRRVGAVLLAIVVAVGSARVAAHVHHPVDILGSFLISAIATVAAVWTTKNARIAKLWQR